MKRHVTHMGRAALVAAAVITVGACGAAKAEVASTTTTTTQPPTTPAPTTTTTHKPICEDGTTHINPQGEYERHYGCVNGQWVYQGEQLRPVPVTTAPPTTVDDAAKATEADTAIQLLATGIVADPKLLKDLIETVAYLVDSVDVITAEAPDPSAPTIHIAVTTGFSGVEYRDETAWAIARSFGQFLWMPDTVFRNEAGRLRPGLHLTVDDTEYVAPYGLMAAIGDYKISSTDWLTMARH